MAKRIPKSFIDELSARTDLVALIASRIPIVKRSGNNHFARCPFHDEKTPSFCVNNSKGNFYCFGCHAGGDAIRFLMEYDNLSFPEAVETLAGFNGLSVPYEEQSHDPHVVQRKSHFDLGLQCLQDAALFFSQTLASEAGKEGREYLRQRGLSPEIILAFQLGFAPRGNVLLQHLHQKYPLQLLQDVGLIGEKDGRHYDWFRHRLMFPIHNIKGQIIGFGARTIRQEEPKYLNSPETDWFNKRWEFYGLHQAIHGKDRGKTLIVTEGYMDVISLHQAGIDNAIAALGTAIGESHITQLQKRAESVFFSFDGDQAGEKAAAKALEAVFARYQQGRTQNWAFVFLPAGEDPDSLLQKEGRTGFERAIAQALPISRFVLRLVNAGLEGVNSSEAQMQRIQRAQEWLLKLNHLDFRECLREEIQQTFALPRLVVSAKETRPTSSLPFVPASPNANSAPSARAAPKPSLKTLRLLAFLWLYPHFALPLRRWAYGHKADFSAFWQVCYSLQVMGATKEVVTHFLTARGWLPEVEKLAYLMQSLPEEACAQEFNDLIASLQCHHLKNESST